MTRMSSRRLFQLCKSSTCASMPAQKRRSRSRTPGPVPTDAFCPPTVNLTKMRGRSKSRSRSVQRSGGETSRIIVHDRFLNTTKPSDTIWWTIAVVASLLGLAALLTSPFSDLASFRPIDLVAYNNDHGIVQQLEQTQLLAKGVRKAFYGLEPLRGKISTMKMYLYSDISPTKYIKQSGIAIGGEFGIAQRQYYNAISQTQRLLSEYAGIPQNEVMRDLVARLDEIVIYLKMSVEQASADDALSHWSTHERLLEKRKQRTISSRARWAHNELSTSQRELTWLVSSGYQYMDMLKRLRVMWTEVIAGKMLAINDIQEKIERYQQSNWVLRWKAAKYFENLESLRKNLYQLREFEHPAELYMESLLLEFAELEVELSTSQDMLYAISVTEEWQPLGYLSRVWRRQLH